MLVIPEKRRIIINSNENDSIAHFIPHAKTFTHKGDNLVALPYGVDESIVLRNLGFSVPPPILSYYGWPARFAPMEHQKETAAFLTMHKRALCLNAPGTGKSISSIWAADFLLQEGVAKKVLIVAPLSTVQVVWGRELAHHLPHRSFVVCVGNRAKRSQLLSTPGVQYVIINHDGFTTMKEELTDFDVVIYDEATALKTPGSIRYKVFSKWISTHQPWLWLLTGTPISQSPVDAWTLARLVDSDKVPKSFTTFKDMVMKKVTTFKWVPREDALEVCKQVLQPSIRFSLDECKDLPDTNYVGRSTTLTKQQEKAFKDMQDKAVTIFAEGAVVAPNAAVVLSKLLQISCIAYNTDVLTDKGWIPIQSVTSSHRVWDGDAWVPQDGAVLKGHRPTVSVGGVQMTADHRVWVGEWVAAQEIVNGDASERFARYAVRLPDGYCEGAACSGKDQNSPVALPMRMRERSNSAKPVPAERGARASAQLWLPPRKRNTQDVWNSAIPNLDKYDSPLHGRIRQRLATVWGTWCAGLRTVAALVRQVLEGYASDLRRFAYAGSNQCEWKLHAAELPLGDYRAAEQQPKNQSVYKHAAWKNDRSASRTSVRSEAVHAIRATKPGVVGEPCAVYDLINCGPRNRFVVRGDTGVPVIVHNCGVVYGTDGPIAIDAEDRYNTLTELLDEIGDKAIIFVPLKAVQLWLQEKLTADGYDIAMVNGDTSKNDRNQIFSDFQHTDNPRILLAHPKVAAHGLTLTRAKDIIWFAPIYSLEQYEQANARIRRLTTTGKTSVWHIYATKFEAELYRRLKAKKNTLAEFLNLVRGVNSDE